MGCILSQRGVDDTVIYELPTGEICVPGQLCTSIRVGDVIKIRKVSASVEGCRELIPVESEHGVTSYAIQSDPTKRVILGLSHIGRELKKPETVEVCLFSP